MTFPINNINISICNLAILLVLSLSALNWPLCHAFTPTGTPSSSSSTLERHHQYRHRQLIKQLRVQAKGLVSVPASASASASVRSFSKKGKLGMVTMTMHAKKDQEDENRPNPKDFKLGQPIDLPSLHPQDAGPMYGTCRSVSGVEKSYDEFQEEEEDANTSANAGASASANTSETVFAIQNGKVEEFKPKKPIQLDSLSSSSSSSSEENARPSFFGLEPKSESERMRDGSGVGDDGMVTPLPLFTGTVIMLWSLYLIYLALFGEDVPVLFTLTQ